MAMANLKEFESLPKFSDGRVDYTKSKRAPVVICFVKYDEELLLLKRSDKVMAYPNLWSVVAGFIDIPTSLDKLAISEVHEETGMLTEIKEIKWTKPYEFTDIKTWIRHVCLVKLSSKPEIKLNEENTEYAWVKKEDIKNYKCVPGMEENIKALEEIDNE